MASRRGTVGHLVIIRVLLGGYSLALSIIATLLFRLLVFLPPASAFEFLQDSIGMAGILLLGGALATSVSTLVHYLSRKNTSHNWPTLPTHFIVAAAGPAVAIPPGFVFLVGTMGWVGFGLLISIAVAAVIGYWVILGLHGNDHNQPGIGPAHTGKDGDMVEMLNSIPTELSRSRP